MIENLKNFISGLNFINAIRKFLFPNKGTDIEVNAGNKVTVKGNENIVISDNNSGSNVIGENITNSGNITYNTYLQQNSSNKEEEIISKIVENITLLTELLKKHCINAPSLSEETERDPRRNEGLSNEEIAKLERNRIDAEIIGLFRELRSHVVQFDFYSENKSLVEDLKQFYTNMWGCANSINFFIMYKFSFYLLHEDSNYFFDKLQTIEPNMLMLSENIEKQKKDLFEKLKKSIKHEAINTVGTDE